MVVVTLLPQCSVLFFSTSAVINDAINETSGTLANDSRRFSDEVSSDEILVAFADTLSSKYSGMYTKFNVMYNRDATYL